MKVILTEEVEKLGGINDVVEVADGYARNYLLPRSMAMPASKSAMANLDNMRRIADRREDKRRAGAQEQAATLEGKTLIIPSKSGAAGRLFGSIGTLDIVTALKAQFGVEIERRQIALSEPIRSVGLYPIPLALHRDVRIQLMVQIGEGAAAQVVQGVPGAEAPAPVAPAPTVETDAGETSPAIDVALTPGGTSAA